MDAPYYRLCVFLLIISLSLTSLARFFFEIPYGRNNVSPGSEQNEPTRAKPVRRVLVSVEEFQIEGIYYQRQRKSERLEGVKQ